MIIVLQNKNYWDSTIVMSQQKKNNITDSNITTKGKYMAIMLQNNKYIYIYIQQNSNNIAK